MVLPRTTSTPSSSSPGTPVAASGSELIVRTSNAPTGSLASQDLTIVGANEIKTVRLLQEMIAVLHPLHPDWKSQILVYKGRRLASSESLPDVIPPQDLLGETAPIVHLALTMPFLSALTTTTPSNTSATQQHQHQNHLNQHLQQHFHQAYQSYATTATAHRQQSAQPPSSSQAQQPTTVTRRPLAATHQQREEGNEQQREEVNRQGDPGRYANAGVGAPRVPNLDQANNNNNNGNADANGNANGNAQNNNNNNRRGGFARGLGLLVRLGILVAIFGHDLEGMRFNILIAVIGLIFLANVGALDFLGRLFGLGRREQQQQQQQQQGGDNNDVDDVNNDDADADENDPSLIGEVLVIVTRFFTSMMPT